MLRNIDRAMRLQELDSQQVRELQQELGGLVVDGVMGPRTEARWKEWKKANNQAEPDLIGPGSVRQGTYATMRRYGGPHQYRGDTRAGETSVI
jgi:peptidoglycan hydrolase-like protein with peptidoglycan-binding domain